MLANVKQVTIGPLIKRTIAQGSVGLHRRVRHLRPAGRVGLRPPDGLPCGGRVRPGRRRGRVLRGACQHAGRVLVAAAELAPPPPGDPAGEPAAVPGVLRVHRLEAFFTPARFRDDYPIATTAEREAYERDRKSWEGEVAATQAAVIRLESPVRNALRPGLPPGLNDDATAAFQTPEAERTPDQIRVVFEALAKDRRIDPKVWTWALDGTSATIRGASLARLDRLRKAAPPALPRARGLDEVDRDGASDLPPASRRLTRRRDPRSRRRSRRSSARPNRPRARRSRPSPRSSGRRRALAEWLVRPDHPLTARVMVNRLWQGHFGRGIVATPSDFGTMGDEPSHPELLDWLATEFVRGGWSLKAMHRLMVTSATYRQSSRADRPPRCSPIPRTSSSAASRADASTARRSATPCSPSRVS